MAGVYILKLMTILYIVTTCRGRVINGLRQARLSLAESLPYYYVNNIDGQPGTYSFGYDISDAPTGNTQYRTEERYANGTVAGSYGYIDAWGKPQRFRYIADANGYRVTKEQTYPPLYAPPSSNGGPAAPSVTWSRPRRPNWKQNKINSISNDVKIPVLNILKDKDTSFLRPPSYYADD